jgi:hypothetical protein
MRPEGRRRRVYTRATAETERAMLTPILDQVSQFIAARGVRDGYFPTPIEGFGIVGMTEGLPLNGTMYKPSLCITLQGAKEVAVGDQLFVYDEMSFLLVAVDVPAYGRVTRASPERPYVGIMMEIDTTVLRAVLDELDDPPVPSADDRMNVFAARLDGPLAGACCASSRCSTTRRRSPCSSPRSCARSASGC